MQGSRFDFLTQNDRTAAANIREVMYGRPKTDSWSAGNSHGWRQLLFGKWGLFMEDYVVATTLMVVVLHEKLLHD